MWQKYGVSPEQQVGSSAAQHSDRAINNSVCLPAVQNTSSPCRAAPTMHSRTPPVHAEQHQLCTPEHLQSMQSSTSYALQNTSSPCRAAPAMHSRTPPVHAEQHQLCTPEHLQSMQSSTSYAVQNTSSPCRAAPALQSKLTAAPIHIMSA